MKFFVKMAVAVLLVCSVMVSQALANIKVVFVTAENGLGDQSFNDMIHEGLKKAKEELGIDFVFV